MTRTGLVVMNGLGLEEGLASAIAGAEEDGAAVLAVAPLVDPIGFGEEPLEEGESHDEHEHGDEDPHFWLDVTRMATAAALIGDALAPRPGTRTSACAARRCATRCWRRTPRSARSSPGCRRTGASW
jgi:zinc/manganese transport system substrate-binding protein